MVLDGTTQPGFGTTPVIELNGNGLGAHGLRIFGSNSIVRGLAINRFGGVGIFVMTGGDGNVIEGNHIGTNPAGTLAQPNGGGGILVQSANNRIGGLTPAARNVISGNAGTGIVLADPTATGNVVQGNYIGVNVTGTAALPNTLLQGGINVTNGASGNTIGGSGRRGWQRRLGEHPARDHRVRVDHQRQRHPGQLHRHESDRHDPVGERWHRR